jgi:hypothetical protein
VCRGRRLPQTPSINRLTSLPDSVRSKRRRSRLAEFQHIKRRHRVPSKALIFSVRIMKRPPRTAIPAGVVVGLFVMPLRTRIRKFDKYSLPERFYITRSPCSARHG